MLCGRVAGCPRRASLASHRTPPELAKQYGVSPDKVLAWIRAGELRAINVATRLGGRPRYRISEEDLAAFEARRAARPSPKRQRPARPREANDVIEFF
jgi:excisionase family DNA binding protein